MLYSYTWSNTLPSYTCTCTCNMYTSTVHVPMYCMRTCRRPTVIYCWTYPRSYKPGYIRGYCQTVLHTVVTLSLLSFQDLAIEDTGAPPDGSSPATTSHSLEQLSQGDHNSSHSSSDLALSQTQLLAASKTGRGVSRTLTLHMYLETGSNSSSAPQHSPPQLLATVGHRGTAGTLKMLLYTVQSDDNDKLSHFYLYPNSSTDDPVSF